MNLTYKTYAWIGLAGIIISLIAGIFQNTGSPTTATVFNILSYISMAFFVWAFVDIADKVKNNFLLIGSAVQFISILLAVLITTLGLFFTLPINQDALQNPLDFGIAMLMIVGVLILVGAIISILTGVGFLKLKEQFGGLAKATGILNIILGVFLLLMFFPFLIFDIFTALAFLSLIAILLVLVGIAAFVLEVIILFKADKVLD